MNSNWMNNIIQQWTVINNIMNSQKQQQTILNSIFSLTEETIHLFNTIIKPEYEHNLSQQQLEDDIARFFNGLIWAEKKNPLLLYQMFQMKSCEQIVEKYVVFSPVVILRNSILLMGNCQPGGLVAEQLMEARYPHLLLSKVLEGAILKGEFGEEVAEHIGSFLKCYYKLFKIQWLNKFIFEGEYFQLLQINLKYYNCPDFMARTNALNIVLDLFKHEPVRKFISQSKQRNAFYKSVFQRMCKLFRNQLAQFGLRIAHISKQDNIDYIFSELQDKISLWIDFSNNFAGLENLLELSFCSQVLLPLIIGPLETNQMPLFSLKYSLFVIKRLLPIMKNLNILEIYIRMIFIEQKVFYDRSSLRKAFIEPFSLRKLLTKQTVVEQTDELESFNKIRQMYNSILTSRDNHFILMVNSLFSSLFQQVRKCPQLTSTYGFGYTGQMSTKVSKILLGQLKQIHQLHTIQCILNTLISINNCKCLETDLQNQYIYIYQHIISQLENGLTPGPNVKTTFLENARYLAECLQYDIDIVGKIEFVIDKNQEKYEKSYKIVFQWEVKKEQIASKQFYARVPDSGSQYLRYMFVKLMLLQKAKILLVDNSAPWSLHEQYYQKMITRCPYIAEDQYNPHQIQQWLHICQLSTKQQAPHASYFISDQNFLVLGVPKGQKIVITHGIKIKHVELDDLKKKKIKIKIKQWDDQHKEVKEVQQIFMKNDQLIIKHLNKKIEKSIQANLQYVKKSLKKKGNELPPPSLI